MAIVVTVSLGTQPPGRSALFYPVIQPRRNLRTKLAMFFNEFFENGGQGPFVSESRGGLVQGRKLRLGVARGSPPGFGAHQFSGVLESHEVGV